MRSPPAARPGQYSAGMKTDPRFDAYIAGAAPFARPILKHLRKLVHQACPKAEETMKWGSPFFMYRDKILCFTAAFKAHAAFGFWGPTMKKVITADGRAKNGRGLLGRITNLTDLPPDKALLGYIRTAQQLHESGKATPLKRKARPALPVPSDLASALRRNKKAAAAWAGFSPGARREYIEWITDARREETREQRLHSTIEWVAEDKRRNWKYEKC